MITLINTINLGILIFFIFSAIIYTIILIGSFPQLLKYFNRSQLTNIYSLMQSSVLPPVTVITACYNEKKNIVNNVLSTLQSNYKNLYLILINDGSTDNTLDIMIQTFDMQVEPLVMESIIDTTDIKAVYVSKTHNNLILIDKKNTGVGDSLNIGINACFTPYFISIDADSIVDESAISELMYELLSNPKVIAVGGGVYILNGSRYHLGKIEEARMPYQYTPAMQTNEYLRSHLFNRTGWNIFGATMSYSGTATLLRKEDLLAVNGYDTLNFAQDTEIVMRLHHYMHEQKRPYKMLFNPAATVWTQVPNNLITFSRQRDRWQRGLLRSISPHINMFFNPKYKIQGLFSFPAYVLLEIIAPFVEFTAYFTLTLAYYLNILNLTSAILYLLLAWGFTSYLTMANMFINLVTFNRYTRVRDTVFIFFLALFEMVGFRQYHTGVKIWGSLHYLLNRLKGKDI